MRDREAEKAFWDSGACLCGRYTGGEDIRVFSGGKLNLETHCYHCGREFLVGDELREELKKCGLEGEMLDRVQSQFELSL